MSQSNLDLERQKRSATVLANASTLVAGIVQEIAGNDISNSINGSKASSELIQMLANQRMVKQLNQPQAPKV